MAKGAIVPKSKVQHWAAHGLMVLDKWISHGKRDFRRERFKEFAKSYIDKPSTFIYVYLTLAFMALVMALIVYSKEGSNIFVTHVIPILWVLCCILVSKGEWKKIYNLRKQGKWFYRREFEVHSFYWEGEYINRNKDRKRRKEYVREYLENLIRFCEAIEGDSIEISDTEYSVLNGFTRGEIPGSKIINAIQGIKE